MNHQGNSNIVLESDEDILKELTEHEIDEGVIANIMEGLSSGDMTPEKVDMFLKLVGKPSERRTDGGAESLKKFYRRMDRKRIFFLIRKFGLRKARELIRHDLVIAEAMKHGLTINLCNLDKMSGRQLQRRNDELLRSCGLTIRRRQSRLSVFRRVVARTRSFGRAFRSASRPALVTGNSNGGDGGGDSSSSDSDLPRPGIGRAHHSVDSPNRKKLKYRNSRRTDRSLHIPCCNNAARGCR